LYYREDLHELTTKDYANLIENQHDREKFLNEIESISNFATMTKGGKSKEEIQEKAKVKTETLEQETETNFQRLADYEITRILQLCQWPEKLQSYLQEINSNIGEVPPVQSIRGS
jgi:hypothetical protein